MPRSPLDLTLDENAISALADASVDDLVGRLARRAFRPLPAPAGDGDGPEGGGEDLDESLARLHVLVHLARAVERAARREAGRAASAGAGYPQLGAAWRISRQAARRRWPGLVPGTAAGSGSPRAGGPVPHASTGDGAPAAEGPTGDDSPAPTGRLGAWAATSGRGCVPAGSRQVAEPSDGGGQEPRECGGSAEDSRPPGGARADGARASTPGGEARGTRAEGDGPAATEDT